MNGFVERSRETNEGICGCRGSNWEKKAAKNGIYSEKIRLSILREI